MTEQVEPSDGGIGFACVAPLAARAMPPFARAVLTLLQALRAAHATDGLDRARLAGRPGAFAVWRRVHPAPERCRAGQAVPAVAPWRGGL